MPELYLRARRSTDDKQERQALFYNASQCDIRYKVGDLVGPIIGTKGLFGQVAAVREFNIYVFRPDGFVKKNVRVAHLEKYYPLEDPGQETLEEEDDFLEDPLPPRDASEASEGQRTDDSASTKRRTNALSGSSATQNTR